MPASASRTKAKAPSDDWPSAGTLPQGRRQSQTHKSRRRMPRRTPLSQRWGADIDWPEEWSKSLKPPRPVAKVHFRGNKASACGLRLGWELRYSQL